MTKDRLLIDLHRKTINSSPRIPLSLTNFFSVLAITVANMRTALVFLLIASILCFNFILFYFLGIPKLFKELVENHKKKNKTRPKQEWIEMQSDVQQRAKERRRKEEKQRWERNAARKRSGFYAELEQAYNKA
jgi:hypothetical protein